MADYRVKIGVRNNRILKAIEDAGYPSVLSFTKAFGISYPSLNKLIRMRQPAVTQEGWSSLAVAIAAALSVNPEDLFNERQASAAFNTTNGEFETDDPMMIASASAALPSLEDQYIMKEAATRAQEIIDCLEPRRRFVFEAYLEGKTLRQTSCDMADEGYVSSATGEPLSVEMIRYLLSSAQDKVKDSLRRERIGLH